MNVELLGTSWLDLVRPSQSITMPALTIKASTPASSPASSPASTTAKPKINLPSWVYYAIPIGGVIAYKLLKRKR